MITPVIWRFERVPFLPILDVIGECPNIDLINEKIMLGCAVKFIEKAENFQGRPYNKPPKIDKKIPLSVSFALIFPTEKDLEKYMDSLNTQT